MSRVTDENPVETQLKRTTILTPWTGIKSIKSIERRGHPGKGRTLAVAISLSSLSFLAVACGSSTTSASTLTKQSTPSVSSATKHKRSLKHAEHKKHPVLLGTVTTVGPTSLSILQKNGTRRTVTLESSTVYKKSGAKVNQSSLTTGERVRVRLGTGTSSDVAKIVNILPSS
ncbi:MAG: hypothetical protein M1131_02750 [Actinobacteria bacterium]|nr:hypothetical protein [Actinomycetota bacterium]MCL6095999.1 hypothetical protein [Actinomycetota bacterium]